MCDHQIDRIARSMADHRSRRRLLKNLAGVAGSVLGLAATDSVTAKPKDAADKCRNVGKPCDDKHPCCDELVCIPDGPGRAGRCAPCPNGATYVDGACETVLTFDAAGGPNRFVVPDGVSTVEFDALGAAGGASDLPGGRGGRAAAAFPAAPGDVFWITVGGGGGNGGFETGGTGGFNGGGDGGGAFATNGGAGGGGASDVRAGGTALSDRILVAGGGGGGGGGTGFGTGGDGGGTTGGDGGLGGAQGSVAPTPGSEGGDAYGPLAATGGTQTSGGTGGYHELAIVDDGTDGTVGSGGDGGTGTGTPANDDDSGTGIGGGGGGGGAGYFGGGGGGGGRGEGGTNGGTGGEGYGGGGAGGSGFVTPSGALIALEPGVNSGNGRVTVAFTQVF